MEPIIHSNISRFLISIGSVIWYTHIQSSTLGEPFTSMPQCHSSLFMKTKSSKSTQFTHITSQSNLQFSFNRPKCPYFIIIHSIIDSSHPHPKLSINLSIYLPPHAIAVISILQVSFFVGSFHFQLIIAEIASSFYLIR